MSFLKTTGAAAGVLAIVVACLEWHWWMWDESKKIKQKEGTRAAADYDVAIVGAGPAGSTAAYYLAKLGLKVALLDKKVFPRPKPCGDAWCKPALDLLEDMGILQQMEQDGIVLPVKRGGFVSPFGYECINTDSQYGSVTGCKTYAIKRYIADEYLVNANKKLPNVSVFEGVEVVDAVYEGPESNDVNGGVYRLAVSDVDAAPSIDATPRPTALTATFVLVCDGSTSYLAQKMGLLPKGLQSQATCSHQYLSRHNWPKTNAKSADGVMIFNHSVLPGYSALFRHYDDTVYLGTYVLPGGKATSRAIAPFEHELTLDHPYVSAALGSAPVSVEKRIVAPIRCGGVGPHRSYAKQLFLVGDAAGHVDPLTGEGIHTAMMAGKIAAGVIQDCIEACNFSMSSSGTAYERRIYDAFGYEFWSSAVCARVIYYMPIALDAVAVVGQRRGQAFLDFFGECMTGVRPKSDFVTDPQLLVELSVELVRQLWIQYVLRRPPKVPQDIGQKVVDSHYASK